MTEDTIPTLRDFLTQLGIADLPTEAQQRILRDLEEVVTLRIADSVLDEMDDETQQTLQEYAKNGQQTKLIALMRPYIEQNQERVRQIVRDAVAELEQEEKASA